MDWWTQEQAGLIGAILGGGFGGILVGALGGGLCGGLAAVGRARRFVMSYLTVLGVLAAAMLLGAAVAGIMGQPYHVWFPLLLPGGLTAVLFGVMVPAIRARYIAAEERRLAAEEFRRA